MPKVSKDSAPQRQEAGPVVDLRDELDGYTVTFTSLVEDIDATPFMKGLPDDRCRASHWGYVIKGKTTARYADRDEVFEAGDAFYTPPGPRPGDERARHRGEEARRGTPSGRRPCCIKNTPAAATRRGERGRAAGRLPSRRPVASSEWAFALGNRARRSQQRRNGGRSRG